MKPSVMFLLGSGTSRPAKFPSTSILTSQIFSGNNIIRGSDSKYYWNNQANTFEKNQTNDYLPKIILLFKTIKNIMKSYVKEEPLTYEILYYFIQQLCDYESGELLNMALYPFINEVKTKMPLSNEGKITRYVELFYEAEVYIRNTVWSKLAKVPLNKHTHLAFLSDAINDKDISMVNITTLNHDLLIEKHFDDQKIHLNDGFDASLNGVRYWKNNFRDKNNLLKIHGSIDWFSWSVNRDGWFNEKIAIIPDEWNGVYTLPNGDIMSRLPDKEPYILIGTFNKIYEYTESIFSDIYNQFRILLKKTNNLIVSGYSFGDKGINTAILDWLYTNAGNKIIIIHHDPASLLANNVRSAIRKAYTGQAKTNFVTIPKQIQDTSWKEIKTKI